MIAVRMNTASLLTLILLIPFGMIWSCSSAISSGEPESEWKSVEKGGMEVRWRFSKDESERIEIEMTAPTRGWLAIGFNTRSGLAGTNLIMGAVIGEKTKLSDQYVARPGDHREIADLGGESWLQLAEGEETSSTTRVRFFLPMNQTDKWHHALAPGKHLFLLIAFSREDDFDHHSMMRTEVAIEL